MSHRNIATASIVLLPLFYLIILLSLGSAAAQAITLNQLVTSGQSVTLQAPSGNYLYQWTANWDNAQQASGTSQKFVFTAPTVTQDVGQKTVTVILLVRSVEGGCTNQSTGSFNVYSLPVCGIGGPATVGPYDSSTYTYTGGTTGTLTWQWDVDGTKLGPNSPNFVVDWTAYAPGNHTIGLTLTKDYSSVAAGSTNPFRTIVCKYPVNMTYTSGLAVTKTPSRTTADVGQAVTYNYTVTNTGTISIKSIAMSDSKLGTIPLSINTLKPGATTSASVTYTINETDLPGPLSNNVTVTGNEDKTNKQVRATASATISLTYKAALNITKIPSPTTVGVGQTVTYTYTMKNSGNVTVHDLALSDSKVGPIILTQTTLAPGASTTATKSYTVMETDLPGPLNNTVTATATDSQNVAVPTAKAMAIVPLRYASSINVTKTASLATAGIGQTITYTYTVKNTGNVTVHDLALSDSRLGAVVPGQTTLAPSATTTATKSYTVVETDLPGPLANTVNATSKDILGVAVPIAKATASVAMRYAASMSVTKVPSITTAGVGQTITYTYTVKNTGNVTVHDLALSDSRLGAVTPGQTTLAPSATTTATKSYTVVETDLPGPLANTVNATSKDILGVAVPTAKATASVAMRYAASMSVTKVPSITTAGVGQTITYTYTVKNTGNVTVHDLALSDSRLGAVTPGQTTLAPDASTTATATYVMKETDLPGPLSNTVNATSKDILGVAVPIAKATASVTARYAASMSVTKVPSITTAGVGQTVTYTYTVKNTGNVTVHDLALSDSRLGAVTPGQTALAPDASTTATAAYVMKETDLPGPLSNTVAATATDILGVAVSNTATAAVELTYIAALSLTKVPSVATANVGETVTYTFGVENTGDVTINSLTLSDPKVGPITPAKSTLAPGESTTATSDYVVKDEDLPGPLNNTVTATAMDRLGLPVLPATKGPTAGVGFGSQLVSTQKGIEGVSVPSAEATATVSLKYVAALSVAIAPSSETVKVGDTITYTFRVENTGKVTVHDLALSDPQVGPINLTQTTLAPGKSTTATAAYLVKETVLPGPLISTVAATATDSQGKPISSKATATVGLTYIAALNVTKVPSVAAANVGQIVTYTFTVTNAGNVTVNGLALSDPKVGPITLTQTTLAPGASTTATASYTVKKSDLGGPLSNIVAATATDSQGKTVSATASATVLTTRAEIDPIQECVFDNGDGTFTAFFGYDNKNDYSLDIPVGKDNRFTSSPDDQGQPTTFEPGRHESVLAVVSKVSPLVWHLDVTDATADKNSPGCSKASCGLDGAADLCLNKVETYTYTPAEDPKFRQTYDWSMAGRSSGTGKSIDLSGAEFELGNYTLSMKVTRYLLDKTWSENFCNMSVKVTPIPSAEIVMEEQPA